MARRPSAQRIEALVYQYFTSLPQQPWCKLCRANCYLSSLRKDFNSQYCEMAQNGNISDMFIIIFHDMILHFSLADGLFGWYEVLGLTWQQIRGIKSNTTCNVRSNMILNIDIRTYMHIRWFNFDALVQANAYNAQRNREISRLRQLPFIHPSIKSIYPSTQHAYIYIYIFGMDMYIV